MLTKSLLAILSVATLSSSHLDDSAIRNELKKIRTIEDDGKRLLAYDTLAGSIGQDSPTQNTPPQKVAGTGKWVLESTTDRMTDEVTPYIYLKSSRPVKDWLGQDMTMMLVVYPDRSNVILSITDLGDGTAFEISFSETTPFTLRVDKKPPVTLQLKVDDDVARLYDYRQARSLIKEICEGGELLIRFEGFDGETKYASFDTRGLSNALVHLESNSEFKAGDYLK